MRQKKKLQKEERKNGGTDKNGDRGKLETAGIKNRESGGD